MKQTQTKVLFDFNMENTGIYKKTILTLFSIFVLIIFVDCAATSNFTTIKLQDIKPHMTKVEVVAVIGEPAYKRKKIIQDIFEIWKYDLYDENGYRREYLFFFDKNDKLRNWNEKTGNELGPLYP